MLDAVDPDPLALVSIVVPVDIDDAAVLWASVVLELLESSPTSDVESPHAITSHTPDFAILLHHICHQRTGFRRASTDSAARLHRAVEPDGLRVPAPGESLVGSTRSLCAELVDLARSRETGLRDSQDFRVARDRGGARGHYRGMSAGSLARVASGLLILAACAGDDAINDPTGAAETSTAGLDETETSAADASTSTDATTSGEPTAGTGSSSDDGVTDDATTGTSSDTGGAPEVGAIVGDWLALDTFAPEQRDHLLVREDGTATAELYYLVDGATWTVQLQATIANEGNGFRFTFSCEDPEPACLELEFDTHCELMAEQLVCTSPDWYYKPAIFFERQS